MEGQGSVVYLDFSDSIADGLLLSIDDKHGLNQLWMVVISLLQWKKPKTTW